MEISTKKSIRYLPNGRIVRLISTIERPGHQNQFVVELGYQYSREANINNDINFDEIEFCEECIVDTIFEKPITEAISYDIEKLEKRKRILMAQIQLLEEKDREIKHRLESLKKYEQLERIEDFISGKITHYCKLNDYYNDKIFVPMVVRVEDERCGDDRTDRNLKLLCLFGKSEKSMEWKLNRYSDGSGNYSLVYPFCSKEEAEKKACEILIESFIRFKQLDIRDSYLARRLMEAAENFGVPIPPGFKRDLLLQELEYATITLNRKEKEYEESNAIVSKINDKINSITE